MRYLVTMEPVETAIPRGVPQEFARYGEQVILPSEEACAKLEAERKILAGGVVAGGRGAAFIVEAASNEELSRRLMSLPWWGFMQVGVTRLESFEERATQVRQMVERLKATLK